MVSLEARRKTAATVVSSCEEVVLGRGTENLSLRGKLEKFRRNLLWIAQKMFLSSIDESRFLGLILWRIINSNISQVIMDYRVDLLIINAHYCFIFQMKILLLLECWNYIFVGLFHSRHCLIYVFAPIHCPNFRWGIHALYSTQKFPQWNETHSIYSTCTKNHTVKRFTQS